MGSTLDQQCEALEHAAKDLSVAVEDRKYEAARNRAKECAKVAGALLQRLQTICELADAGYHVAAVDRALRSRDEAE